MISREKQLKWLNSQNWAKDQITSRGSVGLELSSMNIAIVGAGAIGSVVAELLARLGCIRFTIIDSDECNVGNFSRHTLTIDSVGFSKAQGTAHRLNSIFPFVDACFKNETLQNCLIADTNFLDNIDLVIDATAKDEVLSDLVVRLKGTNKLLISLSTSINAKMLYCYMSKTLNNGGIEYFHRHMKPWIMKQREEDPNPVFPLEGIGCWHPVFPARLDDIWSIVSPIIRQIESFIRSDFKLSLIVVERKNDGGIQINKVND